MNFQLPAVYFCLFAVRNCNANYQWRKIKFNWLMLLAEIIIYKRIHEYCKLVSLLLVQVDASSNQGTTMSLQSVVVILIVFVAQQVNISSLFIALHGFGL